VIDDNADIYNIITSIHRDLVTKDVSLAADKLLIDSRLLTLLSVISESFMRSKISGNAKVISAINFILREYSSDLTVARTASHVGLNPIYFQKQFKLNTGKTVLEYITNLRIERAKNLLENTNLSVIDIAAESGFNSRQSLYQNFKKLYSVSPDEYRQNAARVRQAKYRQTPYDLSK
jgi:two-component system response regulator YesN